MKFLVKSNSKTKKGLSYDCFLCDVCIFKCRRDCDTKTGDCSKLFD